MSKVECRRCDMCGRIVFGNEEMGSFIGAQWPRNEENFDLCNECSGKVQRFIHEQPKRKEVKGDEV